MRPQIPHLRALYNKDVKQGGKQDGREERHRQEAGYIHLPGIAFTNLPNLLRTLPGQEVLAWALVESAMLLYCDRPVHLLPFNHLALSF